MVKALVAASLILAVTVALIWLSSHWGPMVFAAAREIFPALSGETPNTSSRHGLSIAAYNLSFLSYAFSAGIVSARLTWSRQNEHSCKLLLTLGAIVCLCIISSSMFWPGEQLIHLYALILLATVQVLVAAIALCLGWVPLQCLPFFGGILIAILFYFGVALPVLHLVAVLLLLFGDSTIAEYLEPLAYSLALLVAGGIVCYQARLNVASAPQTNHRAEVP